MPNTGNIGLEVPTTGSLVGTWGSAALNPDFIAIDGLLAGVVSVPVSSVPVTLTAPAGSIAPAAGPVESQNAVIRLTGTLTANVTVTLPLPGRYIIENQATGNFVITLRGAVATTEVIGLPRGFCGWIYNDGSRVKFVDLGKAGEKEHWIGFTSVIAAWVTACTIKPYLLCDGSIYNVSDYPALGAILSSSFGGNGTTTFGVPDTRGRVSLPYDGTGTRITVAGCGINGQTLGAALSTQTNTLTRANLPNVTVAVSVSDPGHGHIFTMQSNVSQGGGGATVLAPSQVTNNWTVQNAFTGISASFALNGGVTQTTMNNVQPSIVTGIDVVKT